MQYPLPESIGEPELLVGRENRIQASPLLESVGRKVICQERIRWVGQLQPRQKEPMVIDLKDFVRPKSKSSMQQFACIQGPDQDIAYRPKKAAT